MNRHQPDLCEVLSITEVTIMLSEETRRKLREMYLGELVRALDLQEKQPQYLGLSFDERMSLAVDYTFFRQIQCKSSPRRMIFLRPFDAVFFLSFAVYLTLTLPLRFAVVMAIPDYS